MFINSKKCFEVCEGGQKLVIPRNYIGTIPDWAARHWLVQAAIRDGSISTPDSTTDRALETANRESEKKAKDHDHRPDNDEPAADQCSGAKGSRKQPGGSETK